MKPTPKTKKEIQESGDTIEPLVEYLLKHWDGCNKVRPKGYKEFSKGYCDFDGMREWDDNECELRESEFKGFDTDTTDFNFVRTVSLPQVMYDDTCQGRPPFEVLVWACVSYGMMLGKVLYQERLLENERMKISGKLMDLASDIFLNKGNE